jgi:uncharacterized tellurite resistance protein B-like protein
MQALNFALTTFGHIDGDFDANEREVVRATIRRLVEQRVDGAMKDSDAATKKDVVDRFTGHFQEVFENIDRFVSDVMTEPVAAHDDRDAVVHAKLKLRCFELFSSFDQRGRDALLDAIDQLIAADGHVHPAEAKFRAELAQLLASPDEVDTDDLVEEEEEAGDAGASRVHDIGALLAMAPGEVTVSPVVDERAQGDHQFFKQLELHYSANPERIQKQVQADLALAEKAIAMLDARRAEGAGKLGNAQRVDELEGSHLDGHIQWTKPEPGRVYDVVVLGDLHGCYSALKAGVMQTKFLERVEAYHRDKSQPYPILVFLGDYIDRGIFSLNGVLRSVLQLYTSAPDHVVPIRGNHEYYIEHQGQIYGGVKPAEAINTLKPYLPVDVFRRYMALYETLPNMYFLGRTMFVHGGIPRDRALKQKWKGLASLEDADLRFQMMWSDPSSADVIPAALQDASARFPFGRLQLQSFLQRVGCNVLVRGHEKIEAGFKSHYEGPFKLLTVFSSGGATNNDLPEGSSYRNVQPKGLRVVLRADGSVDFQPFALDWATYNDPSTNGFFAKPMEIEHREG